jgi:hypothetical protein
MPSRCPLQDARLKTFCGFCTGWGNRAKWGRAAKRGGAGAISPNARLSRASCGAGFANSLYNAGRSRSRYRIAGRDSNRLLLNRTDGQSWLDVVPIFGGSTIVAIVAIPQLSALPSGLSSPPSAIWFCRLCLTNKSGPGRTTGQFSLRGLSPGGGTGYPEPRSKPRLA